MINHNILCGILYPECMWIALLPDLVSAVGFLDDGIVYTKINNFVFIDRSKLYQPTLILQCLSVNHDLYRFLVW
jgi:hypothetical protein